MGSSAACSDFECCQTAYTFAVRLRHTEPAHCSCLRTESVRFQCSEISLPQGHSKPRVASSGDVPWVLLEGVKGAIGLPSLRNTFRPMLPNTMYETDRNQMARADTSSPNNCLDLQVVKACEKLQIMDYGAGSPHNVLVLPMKCKKSNQTVRCDQIPELSVGRCWCCDEVLHA